MLSLAALVAFLFVVLIDLAMSGDNVVVVGTLASCLPAEYRKKALIFGMGLGAVIRIILSLFAVYLLMIPGIQVIGAVMLLYVAWKMYDDIRSDGQLNDSNEPQKSYSTLGRSLLAITIADLSMSIDNILAVAASAREHPFVMIFGLLLSIGMMIFAANLVSKLIDKFPQIAWVGLVLIVFVSGKMFYHGIPELIADYHHWVR